MKILRMVIENFQGIKSFKFSPDGDSVSVFGDNGTGKTTLFNAFCWLMYGKPSTAEKNFSPQTVGSHNLNHTAELTIQTDDERLVTLRKDYHEVYKTKRGEADKVFAGCTTDHFIDGVPVREKDYQEKLTELIKSEDVAKILTRYNYFLEDMPVKDRRALLLDVCGDIGVSDIIAADPRFERLYGVIGHHSLDDYLKIAGAERKKINDELKEIPSRIDEANKAIINADGQDEASLLSRREALEKEISSLRDQKASVASTLNADLNKQIAEIHAECANAKAEHTKRYSDATAGVHEEVVKLQEKKDSMLQLITSLDYELTRINRQITDMQSDRQRLLDEWQSVKSQEWSGDTICPTCGQELPAEKIDKIKAEFNTKKSERLEEINRKGTEVSESKIEALKTEAASKEQEIYKNRQALDELKERIGKLADSFEQAVPFDRSPYDKRIAALVEQQKDSQNTIDSMTAEIGRKISDAEGSIREIDSLLAQQKINATQKARIANLMDRQRELAGEAETLAMNIKLCEDFNRKKAELLNDKINSRFKTLQFRLFKELNNGGIEDDCEALIPCDGVLVPFKSANTASRMNAGLEVIDVLSAHYGLSLPIFIDGCESCCHPLDTKAQQIRLYVSEKDKVLRVS